MHPLKAGAGVRPRETAAWAAPTRVVKERSREGWGIREAQCRQEVKAKAGAEQHSNKRVSCHRQQIIAAGATILRADYLEILWLN